MFAEERKVQIIELLRKNNNSITVTALCEALYASGATIRRDLKELESSHLIRRTHGGAMLSAEGMGEDPLVFRELQNSTNKQVIAQYAKGYIKDGMSLFLDSSSTVFALAQTLDQFENLTVITNGLKCALLLSDYKNLRVVCTGGIIRDNSKSMVGLASKEMAARYNATICFMSCRGLSTSIGATEASEEECYIKQQYMQNSKNSILLCDSSKLDVNYICKLAPLSDFHEIITEKKEINQILAKHSKGYAD